MRVPIRKPGKFTHQKPDPHLTADKFAELKNKLDSLKKARPKLADEVRRLAELGDLSENAAYQIAKGKLRSVNQKIIDLENHLHLAIIIQPGNDSTSVQIGHTVTVKINGEQVTYLILGSAETNPAQGVISHNSPIGSAIMGHRVGDTVTIKAKDKLITCTIVNIG
ncbi:MAG: GreA/GreB family elongation factor [Candidatus Buchananbacteria bacterium]|nr:GreA/GreB family elongation factor [Candidatus Buchananbacteria bacterium]